VTEGYLQVVKNNLQYMYMNENTEQPNRINESDAPSQMHQFYLGGELNVRFNKLLAARSLGNARVKTVMLHEAVQLLLEKWGY